MLTTSLFGPALPAHPAPSVPAPMRSAATSITTWTHESAVATTAPIKPDQVRSSSFYSARVSPAKGPKTSSESFVYMSVPRSGEGKVGYSEEDCAEYAADAQYTMSWTSFEYAGDVWVDVTLKTGQPITSVDQVTIRPTDLGLKKQLVNSSTVRVRVPWSPLVCASPWSSTHSW